MSAIDWNGIFILSVLTLLRLGVPILGLWLLCAFCKRALPSQI